MKNKKTQLLVFKMKLKNRHNCFACRKLCAQLCALSLALVFLVAEQHVSFAALMAGQRHAMGGKPKPPALACLVERTLTLTKL